MSDVRRLEQLLRFWEDQWFFIKTESDRYAASNYLPKRQYVGPMQHAPAFRRHLLRSIDEPFDHDRFTPPDNQWEIIKDYGGAWFLGIPWALHAWTRHSRRAYKMSKDLQRLLMLTSLKDLTWKDVSWPFPSFAIALDIPIYADDGTKHDFLLVSRESFEDGLEVTAIRLVPSEIDKCLPISGKEKEDIKKWIARGSWGQLGQWQTRRALRGPRMRTGAFYVNDERINRNVTDSVGLETDGSITADALSVQHIDLAIRLVVGLCKYISTVPGKSGSSNWQPHVRTKGIDPTALTLTSQVCYVGTSRTISPDIREVADAVARHGIRAAFEMCAHFREAHWRRPWGKGNDPDADRSVHVDETIVRRDRLTPGSVPKGAENIL